MKIDPRTLSGIEQKVWASAFAHTLSAGYTLKKAIFNAEQALEALRFGLATFDREAREWKAR